jgi:histone deacetylase 1/2
MQIENNRRRVAYFYNNEISRYSYPTDHPMKPERIAMTHSLVVQYGLYPKMDVYQTRKASKPELQKFHFQPYVDYLSNYVSSSIVNNYELLGISSLVGLRS